MRDLPISLLEHIEELRVRVIKSVVFTAVCTAILYGFSDLIMQFLAKPVGKLVFIDPSEAFSAYVMVALWGGAFAASPFIVYQLWQFLAVGLKKKETKYIGIFTPASFLLFLAGAAFAFFIIIPVGIKLLLSFSSDVMAPMISVSKYISFITTMTLAFGVVFQLPLILLFLTKIGIVTPFSLRQARRYAIVLIFIVAAALTPPDVVSQCSMAVPLLLLYELGIVLSAAFYKPVYRSIDS